MCSIEMLLECIGSVEVNSWCAERRMYQGERRVRQAGDTKGYTEFGVEFYIFLTAHLSVILADNQLDAQCLT